MGWCKCNAVARLVASTVFVTPSGSGLWSPLPVRIYVYSHGAARRDSRSVTRSLFHARHLYSSTRHYTDWIMATSRRSVLLIFTLLRALNFYIVDAQGLSIFHSMCLLVSVVIVFVRSVSVVSKQIALLEENSAKRVTIYSYFLLMHCSLFLSFFTVYTRKMPFLLLPPVDLRRP